MLIGTNLEGIIICLEICHAIKDDSNME